MNTKNLVILAFLAAILGLFVACGKSADSKLITVSGATLAEKLEWLASNAASNTSYLLKISAAHEELAPYNLSYFGSNITIQLKGIGKERVVSFSNNGSLFTVNNGVTLILDNITLTGASGNNNALVRVNSGGSLQLNKDVKISGNSGSGVYNNGGTITMTGGEISGNKGGGVRNDVTYTSIDGEYVTIIGTFTMSGGKISGNTSSSFDGGGVYNNGIFTMSGGEISDNTSSYGGGVSNYGNFTMEDGKISGNTCFIGGGVDNHGTLTMKGGTISGNNAFFYGGGMSNSVTYTYTYDGYISEGMFTMTGGEISGNTASSYGGGVVVGNEAVLFKTGGTITGYTEGDGNSNVVKNDSGVVQNDQGHSVYAYHDDDAYIKQKETTDGPGDVLLSYNGKFDPPVWSGDWDN